MDKVKKFKLSKDVSLYQILHCILSGRTKLLYLQ